MVRKQKDLEEVLYSVLEELEELKDHDDPDSAHESAVECLCRLLDALGYQDVVDAFEELE